MSWTNQRIAGLTGMVGVLAFGGTALGQEATPSSTTELSEVVVTAEKRAERIQDVPVALTVVSSEQLTTEHVYNIADLARTTPSLEMVQAFGGPGGGGQIRGIGTNSFSPTAEGAVGIVVDGVPQGNVNITNIFDVQQVEVLKGPQGTLFGLTSSAGVINMITAAPDPSKFEVKGQLDYSDLGRFGSEFGEETVRAVLNAGDERTGLRRSGYGIQIGHAARPHGRSSVCLSAELEHRVSPRRPFARRHLERGALCAQYRQGSRAGDLVRRTVLHAAGSGSRNPVGRGQRSFGLDHRQLAAASGYHRQRQVLAIGRKCTP
jgi:outer membrane receptor protein involved in Fe transport